MSELDYQIGGTHYKGMAMQPYELCMLIGATPSFHAVAKYLSRWKKDRIQDLEKALHFIKMEEEWFSDDTNPSMFIPAMRSDPEFDEIISEYCNQFEGYQFVYNHILSCLLYGDYDDAIEYMVELINSEKKKIENPVT